MRSMAKKSAKTKPVFKSRDAKSFRTAIGHRDVPSYVTVSGFFETIARSLIRLERRVMEIESRLKSN